MYVSFLEIGKEEHQYSLQRRASLCYKHKGFPDQALLKLTGLWFRVLSGVANS